jgi:hypothetical protein
MPRHIKATDIPAAMREPHLRRYRRQLRDALHSPALTQEQRDTIKDRLANLGQEKPYAKLAARAAARDGTTGGEEAAPEPTKEATPVEEEPPEEEGQSLDDLLGLTKTELIDLASEEGADIKRSWTKTKIAEAILSVRGDG